MALRVDSSERCSSLASGSMRLSERLGLFRYIECSGSHEVWFTDPAAIAAAIEQAGRD